MELRCSDCLFYLVLLDTYLNHANPYHMYSMYNQGIQKEPKNMYTLSHKNHNTKLLPIRVGLYAHTHTSLPLPYSSPLPLPRSLSRSRSRSFPLSSPFPCQGDCHLEILKCHKTLILKSPVTKFRQIRFKKSNS